MQVFLIVFCPLARQVCVYLAGLLLPLPYRLIPSSPAGPQTDRTGWGGSGTGWRRIFFVPQPKLNDLNFFLLHVCSPFRLSPINLFLRGFPMSARPNAGWLGLHQWWRVAGITAQQFFPCGQFHQREVGEMVPIHVNQADGHGAPPNRLNCSLIRSFSSRSSFKRSAL